MVKLGGRDWTKGQQPVSNLNVNTRETVPGPVGLPTLDDGQMVDTVPVFQKYPKIARLAREMVISEKIDGTNAQIYVPGSYDEPIMAGSRERWLFPGKETDNFEFAAWVKENAALLRELGPGRFYGEWFGKGIQRGYGLDERRFVLFLGQKPAAIPACVSGFVPTLYTGLFDTSAIAAVLEELKEKGSAAVPGFASPEGIVIFHEAARVPFKMTVVGDEKPKTGAEG